MGRREKRASTEEPVERKKSMRGQGVTSHNSFARPKQRQSFRGGPQTGGPAPLANFSAPYQPAYGGGAYLPSSSPLNGSGERYQQAGGYPYGSAVPGQSPMAGGPMMPGQPQYQPQFYPMEGSGNMTPQQYMVMMNGGGPPAQFFSPQQQAPQMYPFNGALSPQTPPHQQQRMPMQASNMPSPQPSLQRQQSVRGPPDQSGGGQPGLQRRQSMRGNINQAPSGYGSGQPQTSAHSPQGGQPGLQRHQSVRGPPDQSIGGQPGLQRRQSMRGNINQAPSGYGSGQPQTSAHSPQGGQPGLQRQQSMRGPPDQPGGGQPGLQRRQSMRGNINQAPSGYGSGQPQTSAHSPQGGQPGLQRQQSVRGGAYSATTLPQPVLSSTQQGVGVRRALSSGAALGNRRNSSLAGGADNLARSARDPTNPNYTNLFPVKQTQAPPAQLAPIHAQTPPPVSSVEGYSSQQLHQLQSLPPLPTLSGPGGQALNVPFPFPVPAQCMPAMAAHIASASPPMPLNSPPQAVPAHNGWTSEYPAQAPAAGAPLPVTSPQVSPSAGSGGGLKRMPSILNRKSSFKKDKKAAREDGEEAGKVPEPPQPAPVYTSTTAAPPGAVTGSARKLSPEEQAALMRQREVEYMKTKLQQLEREKAEEERLRQLRFQQAMQRGTSTFASCSAEAAEQELAHQQQTGHRGDDDDDFVREPTVAPAAPVATAAAAATPEQAKPSSSQDAPRSRQRSQRGGGVSRGDDTGVVPPSQKPQEQQEPAPAPSRLKPKRAGSARQQHRMDSVVQSAEPAAPQSVAPEKPASETRPVSGKDAFNAECSSVSDGTRSNRGTVSARAQSAGRRRSSVIQTATAPEARSHRSPTLLLYEMPLRSRKNKGEPVDDSANPLKTYGDDLTDVRVTPAGGEVQKFKVDELVAHRKGSHLINAKVLAKVKNVFLSGRRAAVVALDGDKLVGNAGALDTPSSLAQQRLLRDVLKDVARFSEKLANSADDGSYVDAAVSFALVKKMATQPTADLEAEAAVQDVSPVPLRGSARTHEMVDLLQDDAKVVPFRQEVSALYGARLAGVEYRCLQSEDELGGAIVCAQANASMFCDSLLTKMTSATDAEEKARLEDEVNSCVFVTTCVLTYHKAGSPIVVNTDVTVSDVVQPELSEEDDDDAILEPYRRTSALDSAAPAGSSDTIMSVLTCVSVENRHSVATAALANDSNAPLSVFEGILGAPCYTAVIMSADPADEQSLEGLCAQRDLAALPHPKPMNGSLWQFVRRQTYDIVSARQVLADAPFGSDAQRSAKLQIKKGTQALEQVQPLLSMTREKRFSIQN